MTAEQGEKLDKLYDKLISEESNIITYGPYTANTDISLSAISGYEHFEIGKQIITDTTSNTTYDAESGILHLNVKTESKKVTVSGNGYVMDGEIKRTGNGKMTGNITITYPIIAYLIL